MKVNIGHVDRIVRALFGVVLIGATLFGYVGFWGWIGVVLLGTAAFSFCPLYALLGMNTHHISPTH